MRGTTDRALFEKYAKVVRDFNPTVRGDKSAKEVFDENYKSLHELSKETPQSKPFPRIFGYKAYALALSVHENWDLPDGVPEKTMSQEERLAEALRLAKKAESLDPTDHDLHWALADVQLIAGDHDKAIASFEEAIFLNSEERHPSLFAEAAAAYMYRGDRGRGDHLKAEEYFKKARRQPDWYHWMNGLFLFIKTRQAGSNEEALLDLALNELKSTHAHPQEDHYQSEIQLVLAVTYLRKSRIAADRADNIAERHKKNAELALQRFRTEFPHWKRSDVKRALPFRGDDQSFFMDTLSELWPEDSDQP